MKSNIVRGKRISESSQVRIIDKKSTAQIRDSSRPALSSTSGDVKKKKFSILKKRILKERIQTYNYQEQIKLSEKVSNDEWGKRIIIFDFVDSDEVNNADERDEVVSNIVELTSSFGSIVLIGLVSDRFCKLSSEYSIVSTSQVVVIIEFTDNFTAYNAAEHLNGTLLGGTQIKSVVVSKSVHDILSFIESPDYRANDDVAVSSSGTSGSNQRFVLNLENFLTDLDLNEEDEVQEIISELQEIGNRYGDVLSIWIESRDLMSQSVQNQSELYCNNLSTSFRNNIDDYNFPWGIVEFSDFRNALFALQSLNGRVIGGNVLNTFLYDYPSYFNRQISMDAMVSPSLDKDNEFHKNTVFQYAVRILQYVDCGQLEDEDEKHEVLNEIRSLVGSEELQSVYFMMDRDQKNDTSDLLIKFPSLLKCYDVLEAIWGKLVSGQLLIGEIIAVRSPILADEVSGDVIYRDNLKYNTLFSSSSPGAVLLLQNYITDDDLTEAREDREEMMALKRDLYRLSSSNNHSLSRISAYVKRVKIVDEQSSIAMAHEKANSKVLVACIEYSSYSDAVNAMLDLDDQLFGGQMAEAYIEEAVCRGDDIKNSSSTSTDATIVHRMERVAPLESISQLPMIDAEMREKCNGISMIVSYSNESSSNNAHNSNQIHSLNAVFTYLQAKKLPRQKKHETPFLAIPVASDDINAEIIKMLDALARFQKRTVQAEPLKSKSKLRYLIGLKQVHNSVKSRRAMLILLAPDTEISDVIDDKVQALVNDVKKHEIPVLYCLSRRRLAKALHVAMRQTAVAILKPDGTYTEFKKILKFIEDYQLQSLKGMVS